MTKKTSTPRNPPGTHLAPIWNKITGITAIVLSPSISGRYFMEFMMDPYAANMNNAYELLAYDTAIYA